MFRRINTRIVLFTVVIAALLGTPLYIYLSDVLNRGIVDRGGYKEVKNLKHMGNFQLDPIQPSINDVPREYRDLDGKKVLISGQWYPINESGPTFTRFQLVWNIANCCFNGPPQPQERVFAFMPKGQSAELPGGGAVIRVYGTLHVKVELGSNGQVVSVYRLDVERIDGAS